MHYDPSDLWSRIIDPDPDPSKICGLIRGCTFCIGNVVPSRADAFCNPKLLSIRLLFDQLKIKWQKLQTFILSRCLYVQAFVAIWSFRGALCQPFQNLSPGFVRILQKPILFKTHRDLRKGGYSRSEFIYVMASRGLLKHVSTVRSCRFNARLASETIFNN